MKKTIKFVVYLRLSKPKKGKSREQTKTDAYGIEVQRAAVEALRAQRGAIIIAEYVEIETGTSKKHRPELAKAISHARLHKATLVIGKLDRLARNVHFTSGLMESKVDFVCCDNPEATPLTIHILAAVAEHEARVIAQRTRDSLAIAKATGVKLGSARVGHWDGIEHKRGWKKANRESAKARTRQARDAYTFLIGPIRSMQDEGKSLRAIAGWLNEQGHTTTRQQPFTATAVMRVIEMFKGEEVAA